MDLEVVVVKDGPSCWLVLDWLLLVLLVFEVLRVESGCSLADRWIAFSSVPRCINYRSTLDDQLRIYGLT